MLVCSKCKECKEYSGFAKNKKSKTGYGNWCKACLKSHRDSKKQVSLEEAHLFYQEEIVRDTKYTCKKCGTTDNASRFYFKRDNGSVSITTSVCRPCNHDLSRYKTYGVTPEEYRSILSSQDGCCKICKISEDDYREKFGKSLAVDHCHNSGKVRVVLCEWCNKGLGHFYDNPALLRAASEYLEHYKDKDIVSTSGESQSCV